jgi:hypothetical protein
MAGAIDPACTKAVAQYVCPRALERLASIVGGTEEEEEEREEGAVSDMMDVKEEAKGEAKGCAKGGAKGDTSAQAAFAECEAGVVLRSLGALVALRAGVNGSVKHGALLELEVGCPWRWLVQLVLREKQGSRCITNRDCAYRYLSAIESPPPPPSIHALLQASIKSRFVMHHPHLQSSSRRSYVGDCGGGMAAVRRAARNGGGQELLQVPVSTGSNGIQQSQELPEPLTFLPGFTAAAGEGGSNGGNDGDGDVAMVNATESADAERVLVNDPFRGGQAWLVKTLLGIWLRGVDGKGGSIQQAGKRRGEVSRGSIMEGGMQPAGAGAGQGGALMMGQAAILAGDGAYEKEYRERVWAESASLEFKILSSLALEPSEGCELANVRRHLQYKRDGNSELWRWALEPSRMYFELGKEGENGAPSHKSKKTGTKSAKGGFKGGFKGGSKNNKVGGGITGVGYAAEWGNGDGFRLWFSSAFTLTIDELSERGLFSYTVHTAQANTNGKGKGKGGKGGKGVYTDHQSTNSPHRSHEVTLLKLNQHGRQRLGALRVRGRTAARSAAKAAAFATAVAERVAHVARQAWLGRLMVVMHAKARAVAAPAARAAIGAAIEAQERAEAASAAALVVWKEYLKTLPAGQLPPPRNPVAAVNGLGTGAGMSSRQVANAGPTLKVHGTLVHMAHSCFRIGVHGTLALWHWCCTQRSVFPSVLPSFCPLPFFCLSVFPSRWQSR